MIRAIRYAVSAFKISAPTVQCLCHRSILMKLSADTPITVTRQ